MSTADIPINDSNIQDIIKKEARGLGDDTDFVEVQEILIEHVITKKGNVSKTYSIFLKI